MYQHLLIILIFTLFLIEADLTEKLNQSSEKVNSLDKQLQEKTIHLEQQLEENKKIQTDLVNKRENLSLQKDLI